MTIPAPDRRAYVSSRFALNIDGFDHCGFLKSVDGGGVKAEPITYQQGGTLDLWRSISKPKYEDLNIQIGMGMSKNFYLWIEDFFARKMTRKNGSIVTADFNFKARSERQFMGAQITEVTIPALDGSDKNPGYLTVKMAAESITYKKGDMAPLLYTVPTGVQQKLWKPANFRLVIEGLDCTDVPKIDSFTVKQTPLEDKVGTKREAVKVPGRVEWPNLTIYVPEFQMEPWWKWQEQALLKGKVGSLRTGSIELMSPNLKTSFMTISLAGVQIMGIAPEKAEGGGDALKRCKIELIVEKMIAHYHTNVG